MHIVHGTWVPDEPGSFVQRGYFYLWVETDAPTTGRRLHQGDATHPRHLMQAALATFLEDKLGVREPPAHLLSSAMEIRYLFLPSVDGMPLPCFELLPYVASSPAYHNAVDSRMQLCRRELAYLRYRHRTPATPCTQSATRSNDKGIVCSSQPCPRAQGRPVADRRCLAHPICASRLCSVS